MGCCSSKPHIPPPDWWTLKGLVDRYVESEGRKDHYDPAMVKELRRTINVLCDSNRTFQWMVQHNWDPIILDLMSIIPTEEVIRGKLSALHDALINNDPGRGSETLHYFRELTPYHVTN